MKKFLTILFAISCASISYSQEKQTFQKHSVETLETDKNVFFTQRVGLTPKQAPVFWTLYNEYTTKEKSLILQERDIRKKCLEQRLSDEEYNKALEKLLQIEKEKCELQEAFYKKAHGLLTPKQKILLYDAVKQYRSHLLKKIKIKKDD